MHSPSLFDADHHRVLRFAAPTYANHRESEIEVAVIEVHIIYSAEGIGTGRRSGCNAWQGCSVRRRTAGLRSYNASKKQNQHK
jgi:hypothetical protein